MMKTITNHIFPLGACRHDVQAVHAIIKQSRWEINSTTRWTHTKITSSLYLRSPGLVWHLFSQSLIFLSLPYRATIGRSGVWPSAPAATILCHHPTTSPCVCGKEPESPSSWKRSGRWWGRAIDRLYRYSDTHTLIISELNNFCFYRNEKQSLRRAWSKEMSLWWVFNFKLHSFLCDGDFDEDGSKWSPLTETRQIFTPLKMAHLKKKMSYPILIANKLTNKPTDRGENMTSLVKILYSAVVLDGCNWGINVFPSAGTWRDSRRSSTGCEENCGDSESCELTSALLARTILSSIWLLALGISLKW